MINKKEEKSVDELIAEIDRESAYRRLTGVRGKIIAFVAIAFSLFQLYTASIALLPAQLQRSVHLAFALLLAFLLYPATGKMSRKTLPTGTILFWDLSAPVLPAIWYSILMQLLAGQGLTCLWI